MSDFNSVKINLPMVPGNACVTIDGVEVKGLMSVKVEAAVNDFTKIDLSFSASVNVEYGKPT